MKVYINEMTGVADAITAMYMSKRTWTRQMENDIRNLIYYNSDERGRLVVENDAYYESIEKLLKTLTKFGKKHITLLKYIDFSITVEGLHRGGQDDLDSHAARFNNRIIRSSTRLSNFEEGELSDYYKTKILPTDIALKILGIGTPDEITYEGKTYVKAANGYILKEFVDNKDVKRGLYMLSIPSNFIFKVNLCEWSHVYKERGSHGSANQEVKECCEAIASGIEEMCPLFNRELFMEVKN